MVEKIKTEILDNHKLFNLDIDLSVEKPEILIVNDGEDTVKTSVTWKTNAITIGRKNAELENLCIRTEGKYVCIDSKY